MLDHVSRAEGHDVLELRRVNFWVLRVEAADHAAPSFEAVATLHEADELGGRAEVPGEATQVPLDRLGVGELHNGHF